jgi:hypothetical protein
MSIWNKVLIGLILLASIGFFILGARALKTHQYWQSEAERLEQELAWQRDRELVLMEGLSAPEVTAREERLEEIGGDTATGFEQGKQELEELGGQARMGLRQVQLALDEQLVDRGRVWRGCRPQPSPETAQTGQIKVIVELPRPHRITPNTVLWGFDELPLHQGGRYLGQFTVEGVDQTEVQLKPTVRMTGPALARLNQSAQRNGASWSLYEIMPRDNHTSLAALSEAELKAMLPEETVDEYVSDGQLTTLGDVKQRGLAGDVVQVDASGEVVKRNGLEVEVQAENVEGMYVRQLRDYEELFRHAHIRLTEGTDRVNALTRNNNYIDASLQDARRQVQYRQEERDRLAEVELPQNVRQRDEVAAHLKAVQSEFAEIQKALAEAMKRAAGMVSEIARIQREATQIIDERTRAMAQAGADD